MRRIMSLIIIITVVFVSGCGSSNSILSLTPTPKTTNIVSEAAKAADIVDITVTTGPSYDESENQEIYVYTVNQDTYQKEAVSAVISVNIDITPETIMSIVIDTMEDDSFYIGLDTITTEGDSVIVSFLSEQQPVVGLTEQVEDEILDAIAQSLLDNLTEYRKIIFRIMNEAYITENNSFAFDYVYMED